LYDSDDVGVHAPVPQLGHDADKITGTFVDVPADDHQTVTGDRRRATAGIRLRRPNDGSPDDSCPDGLAPGRRKLAMLVGSRTEPGNV
jgi:hypothetical protein